MIEVFRNTSEYIGHAVYASGTPIEADDDLVAVVVRNPVTGETYPVGEVESLNLGRYQVRLPFAATKYDGALKSYWHYTIEGEEVVAEEDIMVVTPYASLDEITTTYPELQTKNYEELRHMERKVRLIIDKVTGQTFGARQRTVTATTTTGSFALDDRLYHVNYYTVDGVAGSLDELTVLNGGWLVQVTYPPGAYYQVKTDTYLRRGSAKMSVALHGNFGWPVVPNDINMAALILIGDYFCNDSVYRMRGIQAVRAADWRLDFHDSAFTGTGNLDVDLLLSKYAAYNMVII